MAEIGPSSYDLTLKYSYDLTLKYPDAGVCNMWCYKPHMGNVKMCTTLQIFSAVAKFATGKSR